MDLQRVTITGADNNTDISQLIDLSAEFPFVEWGILVSRKNEGTPRFPNRSWIDSFSDAVIEKTQHRNNIHVSTHVCGKWVKDLLVGEINWLDLPSCLEISERVQINTHAELHTSTAKMLNKLSEIRYSNYPKEYIFQWDGINQHFAFAARAFGIKTSVLFDKSGGAGLLPAEWESPVGSFMCGYAGGLGPDNITEQLNKISDVVFDFWTPIWIDMETKVRTNDDSALDLDKVRRVLEAVRRWKREHLETMEPPF
jgi:hypothetical protein